MLGIKAYNRYWKPFSKCNANFGKTKIGCFENCIIHCQRSLAQAIGENRRLRIDQIVNTIYL